MRPLRLDSDHPLLKKFNLKPKKVRRKPVQHEQILQIACVDWFQAQYPKALMFHVPNGKKRSAIQGKILKRMGTRAGVWDLFLMEPRGECPGLWIEAKSEDGDLRPSQIIFGEQAKERGYATAMFRTIDEFKLIVKTYLGGVDADTKRILPR